MYGPTYLYRRPTRVELGAVATVYDKEGCKGCDGAVEVMKVHWKNCLEHTKGNITIQRMESWPPSGWRLGATTKYIWSWFAGRCGTNHDKRMFPFSTLFIGILTRKFDLKLPMPYLLVPGGTGRQLGKFWADGIYSTWPIFVLPIHDAPTEGLCNYKKVQEGPRKGI